MKTRITERDWEILSAYLDGELNAKDAARLESKLRGNADLRDALTELRRTRALLRSQPRLRAPRNFTLTPETAGVRQPVQPARRLSPVFGMVSAFASLLLIVVILGDMFISQPMGVSREMSSAPATYSDVQEVERMAEATSEGALPQEEAPQVLMEQAQPPAGAAEAPMDATSKAAQMPAEMPAAAEAYPYPAPASPSEMSMMVTGTFTLTEEVPEATPIAVAPTAGLDVQANEAAVEVGDESQPEQQGFFWNAWRLAELTLLLLVIATAFIAVRLRRAGN